MRKSLLFVFLSIICSVALHAQPAGWLYSVPIRIQNTGPQSYNTQVPMFINTAQYVGPGEMQPDGSDIRFGSTCNGGTLYNYYLDSGANTNNTLIYLKLDTLKHGDSYVYMFFGNPTAVSVSSFLALDGPHPAYELTGTENVDWYPDYFTFCCGDQYDQGNIFTTSTPIYITQVGKYSSTSDSDSVYVYNYSTNALEAWGYVGGPTFQFNYNQVPPVYVPANTQIGIVAYNTHSYMEIYANCCSATMANYVVTAPGISFTSYTDQCCISSPLPAPPNYNSTYDIEGVTNFQYYSINAPNPIPSYTIGQMNTVGIDNQPHNDTVCLGSNATFMGSTSAGNATYQWQVRNGSSWVNVTQGSTYSGTTTGTLTINNVTNAMNGKLYRLVANSDCGSGISDSVKLVVVHTPAILPTATLVGPNPACAYVNSLYAINTNIVGGTYSWMLNGQQVSTDSTYSFHPANGDQLYAVVGASPNGANGCYSVPEAVTAQFTITTGSNFTPTDSLAANVNNVCAGSYINIRSYSNVQGGSYQWMVNGVPVPAATGSTYTYAPQNGDIITNMITAPNNGCWAVNTANSQQLVAEVSPNIIPVANVTGPSQAAIGSQVTVNADVVNAGSNSYIIWYNNYVRFDSTTVPSVTYTKVKDTDFIMATVHGHDANTQECYGTANSNTLMVKNTPTSVKNVIVQDINVYPNPFTDQIKVTGLKAGNVVMVYNMLGQQVGTPTTVTNSNEQTFTLKGIAAGTYMLHVTDAKGNSVGNVSIKKL